MKAPCQSCPDRHFLCHDKCDKYLKYKRYREAISTERRKVLVADEYHYGITARAEKLRRMHA